MDEHQIRFAKVLADDTRQEIMKLLCCRWMSVNDLVLALSGRVNQPAVSHHLKKLQEAELVHLRKEGRFRYYTLNQQQIHNCCGQLIKVFAPQQKQLKE